MAILNYIVLILAFCAIPAGVLFLCRKVPFLGKIGPVLLLYLTGLIIGNIGELFTYKLSRDLSEGSGMKSLALTLNVSAGHD